MANEVQKRLRRAKDSERRTAKWMQEHDGPDPDHKPGESMLVTSTGRVGHLTHLQFDALSRTYATENKNVKVPMNFWRWWVQVVNVAHKYGKTPCLVIDPAVDQKRTDGTPIPGMHVISPERHAELLKAERELLRLQGGDEV